MKRTIVCVDGSRGLTPDMLAGPNLRRRYVDEVVERMKPALIEEMTDALFTPNRLLQMLQEYPTTKEEADGTETQ